MFISWNEFISLKNIYTAWNDFSGNKKKKEDVINFKMNLENELLQIQFDLKNFSYKHGQYHTFKVYDPKERLINKATVRDRVVHRMLYDYLLPQFNRVWLDCSFSCRPGFGQHLSIAKVKKAIRQRTANYTNNCLAVKCDVRKFFDNIDHHILFQLICDKVYDKNIRALIWEIIGSYSCSGEAVGLPIGNLTSQIFANVYLHEADMFAKHNLKIHHYFRYADDFIFLTENAQNAVVVIEKFKTFFKEKLKLELHPKKIIMRKPNLGIDWLGKIILLDYCLVRTATRNRMLKKIKAKVLAGKTASEMTATVASYNGLLKNTARKCLDNQIAQAVAFYR